MFSRFSWNWLITQPVGVVAVIALMLLGLGLGIIVWRRLMRALPPADKIPQMRHEIISVGLFLVLVFGPPIATMLLLHPDGTVQEMTFYGDGKSSIVHVSFQQSVGKTGKSTSRLVSFRLSDGARLGALRVAGRGLLTPPPDAVIAEKGRVLLIRRGESYRLADRRSFTTLAELDPIIDAARSGQPFRERGIIDDVLVLDLQDGTQVRVDPWATARPEALAWKTGSKHNHCMPDSLRAKPSRRFGLFRTLVSCSVQTDDGVVHLVLHRRTAFDDGDWLLSAFGSAEALRFLERGQQGAIETRWTLDLGALVGDDENSGTALLLVSASKGEDGALEVGLLRARRALMWVRIAPETGEIRSQQVIF